MLDALAKAIDEQIIARAVSLAPKRAQRRAAEAPAARAPLEHERAAVATASRHLLPALALQEEKAKKFDPKLAAFDAQPRPVSLDHARLAARQQPLGHDLQGVLTTRGPAARLVLQRLLSGRRVACGPFRMPGRRGYHFSATGSYGGALASAALTTPPRFVAPIFTIPARHATRAHTRCECGYGSHWCS